MLFVTEPGQVSKEADHVLDTVCKNSKKNWQCFAVLPLVLRFLPGSMTLTSWMHTALVQALLADAAKAPAAEAVARIVCTYIRFSAAEQGSEEKVGHRADLFQAAADLRSHQFKTIAAADALEPGGSRTQEAFAKVFSKAGQKGADGMAAGHKEKNKDAKRGAVEREGAKKGIAKREGANKGTAKREGANKGTAEREGAKRGAVEREGPKKGAVEREGAKKGGGDGDSFPGILMKMAGVIGRYAIALAHWDITTGNLQGAKREARLRKRVLRQLRLVKGSEALRYLGIS